MHTLVFVLCFTSTSIALAAPAFADDLPTKPGFAVMDNTGDGSKVNFDAAAIVPTSSASSGVLLRSSILGQYVAPNGFGGYAGISASTLVFTSDSRSNSGLGSLELGSLYHHAVSAEFDLGLRAGLILPTASHDPLLQLASTLIARPADVTTVSPDTTWLRLGVSPTYHSGPIFLRADFGVDIAIIDGRGSDAFKHINLGAGVGRNGVSATAELQTVFAANDDSFSVASLSVRYQGPTASPFVSISTPLEKEFRGEIVTLTTGLTFPF